MTVQDARPFVARHHRHSRAPQSGLFAVGLTKNSELVGVGIAGRPVARALHDGRTVEITRVCTLAGIRNGCSMIYGALRRAGLALGYRRFYTYTLADETGASLRASGWAVDAELAARPTWNTPSRMRIQTDLFGSETRPPGPKIRWIWQAAPPSGAGERT